MPVGPAALGHEPLVGGEQRKKALKKIEDVGVVNFRESDDPLLPFLPDGPDE